MLQSLAQSAWMERIGWVLVHSLWQFGLVALLVVVLQRALLRYPATTRYWALLVAMFIVVTVPVATWFSLNSADAPRIAAKVDPVETQWKVSLSQDGNGSSSMPGLSAASPLELVATPQAESVCANTTPNVLISAWAIVKQRVQPWSTKIVLFWFGGVLLAAFRPLLSWYTVRRLRTRGVSPVGGPVHDVLKYLTMRLRLARAVGVLQSTLVKTPVVVGHFRPLVLLPLWMVTGLPVEQLEMILAHELAHIRRHDYVVNLLQTLVETLFFYHPAVWWLSRQIRNERENCCDDVAMACGGSRADYGRALLAIEELRAAPPALSLAARGGSLLARIRRIAACEPTPRGIGGGSILGVIMASIAILAAATWVAAQTTAATTAQANTEAKGTVPPVSSGEPAPKEHWPLTLKDAVRCALQNSKVMRQIGVRVMAPTLAASNPAAGPTVSEPAGAIPGSNQGICIARANTDISLATFEEGVRNLVSDVDVAYWELYFDYRNLDSAVQGRDSALRTWQKVFALGPTGGKASAEAQAREQYFLFRSTAEQALKQLHQTERRLRYMMGLAATDGRLIRPIDDPTTAKISFDWAQTQKEAMSRSVELCQARWRARQRELELIAAKNYLSSHGEAQAPPDFDTSPAAPFAFRKQKDGVKNAGLALARERAKLREMELEVSQQLAYAIRDMEANLVLTETNFNRRLAAQRNVDAANAAYDAAGLKPGKDTSALIIVLLDAKRSLAQAESDYYRSVTDYAKSISQVHYRKGSLLEYNGLYLAEGPKPKE